MLRIQLAAFVNLRSLLGDDTQRPATGVSIIDFSTTRPDCNTAPELLGAKPL